MTDGVKISVEEWAGDNGIALTEAQIDELVDAIDTAYEMSLPCGYGIGQLETKEKTEISILKDQVDLLERFVRSKGYTIVLYNNRIEELIQERYGSCHYTLYHRTFK